MTSHAPLLTPEFDDAVKAVLRDKSWLPGSRSR